MSWLILLGHQVLAMLWARQIFWNIAGNGDVWHEGLGHNDLWLTRIAGVLFEERGHGGNAAHAVGRMSMM
jgi:hypothetical protein